MSDPLTLIDAPEAEVQAAVIQIGEQQTGLRNRSPVGVLRGIWETIALIVRRLYSAHISPMYVQADRARATGVWLEMHGRYLAVPPQAATPAKGILTARAAAETQVPAGASVQRDGRDVLQVDADTTLPADTDTGLPVTATTAGAAANLRPGTALSIPALPGVTVTAGVNWLHTPGADRETDDRYRRRIDDRWRSPGWGQPPARFRFVAEGVAGIRQAWIVRTPRGFGSMDVIVTSTHPDGLPTPEQITAVRSALDDYRMICRDIRVRGAVPVPVAVDVVYAGPYTAAEVRQAIQTTVGSPVGGTLQLATIYLAAAALPGIEYFGVRAPLADVGLGPDGIAALTITVSMSQSLGAAGRSAPGTLSYGRRTVSGHTATSQQAEATPGRWTVRLSALGAGETWWFRLPDGWALSALESYGVDESSEWTLTDGEYRYSSPKSVPSGVELDIDVSGSPA